MLLARLVETSERIARTSKRLEKTDLLASLLKQLAPDEVETAVAFLSGTTRQGRIGVGYATLHALNVPAAVTPDLELLETDRALSEFTAVSGPGSERIRRELLQRLFSRATGEEQHFLKRLLIGELRQGALEGIMLDALAKATNIPADRVRRAAMMAGRIGAIARAAIEGGESGLTPFGVQVFRPLQ